MLKFDRSAAKKKAYIADSAQIMGNVKLASDVSVWYNAVIRADSDMVDIGEASNIQDGCILHTTEGYPVVVGNRVTVGHGAILHGCTVGDETLVGMGSVILNGAKIGKNCVVGAGALISQGMEVPDGMMAFGNPARVIRTLTDREKENTKKSASQYIDCAKRHFSLSGD